MEEVVSPMSVSSHPSGGPLLIVGSVALDSVRTPFGESADELGGSARYSAQ